MEYKQKYLKYVDKNNALCNILSNQSGGNKDNVKILKKLKSIKEKLEKKGFSYWFDAESNLLGSGETQVDSKKKMVKKIYTNLDKYIGKSIANATIDFLPDNIESDNKQGCLEIYIEVVTIDQVGKNLSFVQRNEKNSFLRFYYRSDDISKFKKEHIRTLSLKLLNNEIKKTNPFKYYHYDDFDDILSE